MSWDRKTLTEMGKRSRGRAVQPFLPSYLLTKRWRKFIEGNQ